MLNKAVAMKRLIEFTKVAGDVNGSGRTISTPTSKPEDFSVDSKVCMVWCSRGLSGGGTGGMQLW